MPPQHNTSSILCWKRVYMLLVLDSLMDKSYEEHMEYFDRITRDLTLEEVQAIRTAFEQDSTESKGL